MHKWTVRAARMALVAAAITAAGAGIANADDTSGDYSILGGNQFFIPITAPIGIYGNSVNLLSGFREARLASVPTDDSNPTQMDICGNAISNANGIGTASCKGAASVGGQGEIAAPAPPAPIPAPAPAIAEASNAAVGAPTAAVGAPIAAIGAAGKPVAVAAEAPAVKPEVAPEVAPVEAPAEAPAAVPAEAPAATPVVEMSTSGDNSVLGGNQVEAPVNTPVRICGNAGALGGTATAACEGSASSGWLGNRAVRP